MSGNVHLYVAAKQPAMRFVDRVGEREIVFARPGHSLVWCSCCSQRRFAENAVVQVYYDATMFWCAAGRGCKDPAFIAASKRREFRNRSRGNRAAWAKRSRSAS